MPGLLVLEHFELETQHQWNLNLRSIWPLNWLFGGKMVATSLEVAAVFAACSVQCFLPLFADALRWDTTDAFLQDPRSPRMFLSDLSLEFVGDNTDDITLQTLLVTAVPFLQMMQFLLDCVLSVQAIKLINTKSEYVNAAYDVKVREGKKNRQTDL